MVLCALGKSIEFVKKYQDYNGERKEWAEWIMGCVRSLVDGHTEMHTVVACEMVLEVG